MKTGKGDHSVVRMEFRIIFITTKNKSLDSSLILICDVCKSHSYIIVPNLTFRAVLGFFVCLFVLVCNLCLYYYVISTVFDETYVVFLHKNVSVLSSFHLFLLDFMGLNCSLFYYFDHAVILWLTC